MKKLISRESDGGSVCVLVSGGMDSSILISQMGKRYSKVYPLYIRTGLIWEETELLWLNRYLQKISEPGHMPLTVLDLPMSDVYGGHWGMHGENVPDGDSPDDSVYLPGRNILLLSKASVFCSLNGLHTIAIGVLKGNPFPDGSESFLMKSGKVLAEGLDHPFHVIAPFSGYSKEEILQQGKNLPLDWTFSCLSPVGNDHCGECNKCAERRKAFRLLNLPDQTVYIKGAEKKESWVK